LAGGVRMSPGCAAAKTVAGDGLCAPGDVGRRRELSKRKEPFVFGDQPVKILPLRQRHADPRRRRRRQLQSGSLVQTIRPERRASSLAPSWYPKGHYYRARRRRGKPAEKWTMPDPPAQMPPRTRERDMRWARATAAILLACVVVLPAAAAGEAQQDIANLSIKVTELYQAGRFAAALPLAERAARLAKSQLNPTHQLYATALNNLGAVYRELGRLDQAEGIMKEALALRERTSGPKHPDTALVLNSLGELYRYKKQYGAAEVALKRALAIREAALGPEDLATARTLNNLALVRQEQGRLREAEELFLRSLRIRQKRLAPDHPDVTRALENLAGLYRDQRRPAEAEELLRTRKVPPM